MNTVSGYKCTENSTNNKTFLPPSLSRLTDLSLLDPPFPCLSMELMVCSPINWHKSYSAPGITVTP